MCTRDTNIEEDNGRVNTTPTVITLFAKDPDGCFPLESLLCQRIGLCSFL